MGDDAKLQKTNSTHCSHLLKYLHKAKLVWNGKRKKEKWWNKLTKTNIGREYSGQLNMASKYILLSSVFKQRQPAWHWMHSS